MESGNDQKPVEKNFTFNERGTLYSPNALPPRSFLQKKHSEVEHKHNVSESMLALSRSRKEAFSKSNKGSFARGPNDSISISIQ